MNFSKLLIFLTVFPLYSQQRNLPIVAVSDLVGHGISNNEAITISEQLRAELLKTGCFRIMERSQMQEILKEQGFQQIGCTADSCAVEIGQLLGVSNIIVGSLGIAGSYISLTLRVLDVQTGEVTVTETVNVKGGIDNLVDKGIHDVAGKLLSSFSKVMSAAIIEAAKKGNLKVAERLLQRGADVNATDSMSWTPIYYAVCNCNKDIVQILIEKGAEVSWRDHFANTPLLWAAEYCDTVMVAILLKAGAEVNIQNHLGDDPLCKAINYRGSFEVIRYLVKRGANVNSVGFKGTTPLHYAVMNNREDVVKLLLAKAAKVNKIDYSGLTPLEYANAPKLENLLQKAGGKPSTLLEKQRGILFNQIADLQSDSITRGILKTELPVARINEVIAENPDKAKYLLPEGDYAKFADIEEILHIYCPIDSQGNIDVSKRQLANIKLAFMEWQKRNSSRFPAYNETNRIRDSVRYLDGVRAVHGYYR